MFSQNIWIIFHPRNTKKIQLKKIISSKDFIQTRKSDTIVKNIEDCESGIIIEIHYDTPEADPETEPGADPEANPVVAQE